MNNKLAGVLFILFGMSLLGNSIAEVYHNSIGINKAAIKPILGILLGISSSIYGYKRMNTEDTPKKD